MPYNAFLKDGQVTMGTINQVSNNFDQFTKTDFRVVSVSTGKLQADKNALKLVSAVSGHNFDLSVTEGQLMKLHGADSKIRKGLLLSVSDLSFDGQELPKAGSIKRSSNEAFKFSVAAIVQDKKEHGLLITGNILEDHPLKGAANLLIRTPETAKFLKNIFNGIDAGVKNKNKIGINSLILSVTGARQKSSRNFEEVYKLG